MRGFDDMNGKDVAGHWSLSSRHLLLEALEDLVDLAYGLVRDGLHLIRRVRLYQVANNFKRKNEPP